MCKFLAAVLVWCLSLGAALAQDLSGLARIDTEVSAITDRRGGGVTVDLGLSQGVPFRVFLLDGPPRLVIDFREVDWFGVTTETMVRTDRVRLVRFGTFRPGWSRLVTELAEPMTIESAGLRSDPETAAALLRVDLSRSSAVDFAAQTGAPHDPLWDLPAPVRIDAPPPRGPDAPLRVVLDPGHGGIDPGAERGALDEKTLMLTFAREIEEALLRSGGYEVVLTRTADYFVSLERRIAIAHEVGGDVFVSLHADSLADGGAHGAVVYTLSPEASDVASAKLAERHDRDDLLSGVDLSETDDRITDILLDLARQETSPRTGLLAQALVDQMTQTGGPMNRRPHRQASFSVLKAADIPSVLIEIGFLSSPRDVENLRDPEWRAGMATAIRKGLDAWRAEDRARRPLVRQ